MNEPADYQQLHATSPQRSIFSEPWWLDAATGSPHGWQSNLVHDEDGIARAAWPLATRESSHGTIGTGAPYTPFLGPVLPDREPLVERLSDSVELLERLADHLRAHAHVEAACAPEFDYWTPLSWHGFTQTTRTTWRIAAGTDHDTARQNLRTSTRKELTRGERHGITVRAGSVAELLTASAATFARHGLSTPNADALERVAQASLEHGRGEVLAVESSSGELASAGLFVWDDRWTWNLTNGRIDAPAAAGAPTVLMWAAICNALDRGTGFDFEGSMLRPIESFVRGFGGAPASYSVVHRSSVRWSRSVARKRRIKRLLRR